MPPVDKPAIDARVAAVVAEKNPVSRNKLLATLAADLGTGPHVLYGFGALAKLNPTLAMHLVARMEDPVVNGIVLQAAAFLSAKSIPVSLRLVITAKLLLAMPDKPESVGPILRSFLSECTPNKALDRLLALQKRIAKCDTLDTEVERLLRTTRAKCPLCSAKGTRLNLPKHLWAKHRKWTDSGTPLDSANEIETAVTTAARSEDPAAIDRAFELSKTLFPKAPWYRVQQGLASRYWRFPEEYAPLCERAEEHHEGLCPNCYSGIPDPVPALPNALSLSEGRLRGDGYEVEVQDTAVGRTITINKATGGGESRHDDEARFPPRLFALWAGMIAGAIALTLLFLVNKNAVPPFVMAGCGVALMALAYFATLYFRVPIPPLNARAIDIAWAELVPGLRRKPKAVRYIVRLCQVSINQGNPEERSGQVWELAEHALVLAKKGGIYGHLLAAASVLKAHDAAAMGRDFAETLSEAFTPIFKNEIPLSVGEAAARILEESDVLAATDTARLSVILCATAFDAGLTAADLLALRSAAPSFAQLVAPGASVHLRNLYHVWLLRYTKPWKRVGDGDSIFEYAKKSPNPAGRLLRNHPDALLVYKFDNFLSDEIGAVVIRTSGVTWGGETVADPEAKVNVMAGREGGGEVHFGRQIFLVNKRPSDAVERVIRGWLRYRANDLIPQSFEQPNKTTTIGRGMIASLSVRCNLCGVSSVTRSGQLGLLPKENA